VQARGDGEVGVGRLEVPRRVVVKQHLPALGEAGQRKYSLDVAPGDGTSRLHDVVVVDRPDEADLAAAGQPNRPADRQRGSGGEPSCGRRGRGGDGRRHGGIYRTRPESARAAAHVFSGFFLAAGNSTLFRINR
jgi:hypothetical protein